MSALGHYIEAEGVPTASVSLVREHTERIRPPRALWVPFDLGRPFGTPNDREFQKDVLRSLLRLFERQSGPVLEDYPKDAPLSGEGDEVWSCPLPLPPLREAATEKERIQQALLSEISLLMPWYAESVRARGRTTFGLSGLSAEDAPAMASFLAAFAAGESPPPPAGVKEPMPASLRAIADDLKAFYLEAAAAQPGSHSPTATQLNRWLYRDTWLGEVLYNIRDQLATAQPEGAPPRPPVALIPNRFRERQRKD